MITPAEVIQAYRATGCRPIHSDWRNGDGSCGCPAFVLAVSRGMKPGPAATLTRVGLARALGWSEQDLTDFATGFDDAATACPFWAGAPGPWWVGWRTYYALVEAGLQPAEGW